MKAMTIVPTYNEKENIELLVGEILDLPVPVEVVIVDDNRQTGRERLPTGCRWRTRDECT
jgi:GT2 family glycosyltransferase